MIDLNKFNKFKKLKTEDIELCKIILNDRYIQRIDQEINRVVLDITEQKYLYLTEEGYLTRILSRSTHQYLSNLKKLRDERIEKIKKKYYEQKNII